MKVLLTVNTIKAGNTNGNIVYSIAWKRFIEKHANQLGIDILFVNIGFDDTYFRSTLLPQPCLHVNPLCQDVSVPFDTHSTYFGVKHGSDNGYDYVIRVDHDVFPSSRHIKDILSFLEKNPEIDFVSASNLCRSIEHDRVRLPNLDTRAVPTEKQKAWKWFPWKYPSQNGDIAIFKTSFFRKCKIIYDNHPALSGKIRQGSCPFNSNFLRYGEIWQIMGESESKVENAGSVAVHIDGCLNSDFWTIMCASEMKEAGIVDYDGRSFRNKNHLTSISQALTFPSFDKVRDSIDVSFPHEKNVQAPYFHMGSGYVSQWYFDESQEAGRPQFLDIVKDGGLGFYAIHLAIVTELTRLSDERIVQNQLLNRIEKLLKDSPNKREFLDYGEKALNFYKPAMIEFL